MSYLLSKGRFMDNGFYHAALLNQYKEMVQEALWECTCNLKQEVQVDQLEQKISELLASGLKDGLRHDEFEHLTYQVIPEIAPQLQLFVCKLAA